MTNKELFINRELESFPVWTHQRGGKRHVYAASFTTDLLCGTMKRHGIKNAIPIAFKRRSVTVITLFRVTSVMSRWCHH